MTDKPAFEVLEGGKHRREPGFVCPWCGLTFTRRFIASDGVMPLEEHWAADPRCRRHANVNNQTQTKYGKHDDLPQVPGDYNLYKIRAADCEHPVDMRQVIYLTDGAGGHTDEVIGWRCSWCYSEIPSEPSE